MILFLSSVTSDVLIAASWLIRLERFPSPSSLIWASLETAVPLSSISFCTFSLSSSNLCDTVSVGFVVKSFPIVCLIRLSLLDLSVASCLIADARLSSACVALSYSSVSALIALSLSAST